MEREKRGETKREFCGRQVHTWYLSLYMKFSFRLLFGQIISAMESR